MSRIIKMLIGAKIKSEAAYAAFLSTSGSAILFGTLGMLLLRYLRDTADRDDSYIVSSLEKQRDGIEAALISGGIVTRADIDEHGILVALKKAMDAKKS